MLNLLDTFHYQDAVRMAHELADLIKRRRPETCEQIGDLQNIVTRSHQRLDKLQLALDGARVLTQRNCGDGAHFCNSDLASQVAEELNTLQAVLEALGALRHATPKASKHAHQGTVRRVRARQHPHRFNRDAAKRKRAFRLAVFRLAPATAKPRIAQSTSKPRLQAIPKRDASFKRRWGV